MPNWKKVITSGSAASLYSLDVSNGITGSLLGTSSYALQALSSSYATTASFVTGSIFTNSNSAASASFAQTASYVTGSIFNNGNRALSASYAQTASFIAGGTTIAIANGGTGQITNTLGFNALSPVTTRGDIIVRGATNNQRLALGTVGKILRSDGTDLVYTTATYPTTTAVSTLLYSSAANVISALATANNGVLVTGATGVPSISSQLTYVTTTGFFTNTLSINAAIQIGATNVNTGTSTFIQLLANNGTYNFALQQLGTGYATNGLLVANQSRLASSAASSMLINTTVASVPIIFAIGGTAVTNEVHRSTSSGIEFRVLLKSLIYSAANLMAGQITLVGGTLAIAITGLTTSHRGMVTLVTANNVLNTRSYQAVCTANTITIRANTDAGLLNMADTSVLNYFIFLNN